MRCNASPEKVKVPSGASGGMLDSYAASTPASRDYHPSSAPLFIVFGPIALLMESLDFMAQLLRFETFLRDRGILRTNSFFQSTQLVVESSKLGLLIGKVRLCNIMSILYLVSVFYLTY